MLRVCVLGLALVSMACETEPVPRAEAPDFLSSPETRELGLPFSDAVRAGEILYVSGQVGNRPGTLELTPGGLEAEARQTLDNIRSILESHGSGMDRVIKCTIFLADIDDWSAFNQVYIEYFPRNLPARSALGSTGLALGAAVEVECIALTGAPVPE